MAHRWTRLAEIVGLNSIPVLGVLVGNWTPATALSIFWFENLFASILIAIRLALYARWRDPASVPDVAATSLFAPQRPAPFLLTTIPFGIAHGVMLVAVFALVLKAGPDLAALQQAVIAVAVVQLLTFGVDLWTLADWPVRRLNQPAEFMQGRVAAVHLSLIAGMFLFAWFGTPTAFFAFFLGVKVLSDLGQLLPRVDEGTPDAPPRWLSAIMRRFPTQNGETFDEYWRRTERGGPPPSPPRRGRRGRREASGDRLPR